MNATGEPSRLPSARDLAFAREMDALCRERLDPTDADPSVRRKCPDCGYLIDAGWAHGRHPQPDGASHSVCSLQKAAIGPVLWTHDPPWRQRDGADLAEPKVCVRCGEGIPLNWRHFWPGCRGCSVWSYVGQQVLAAFGLDAHAWLYWGARPYCRACDGTGYLPCEPQDMSILRMSGNCTVCGAWSFKLVHATDEDHSDVEGSARHYEGEADHEVVVGAASLRDAITNVLDEHDPHAVARSPE